MRTFIGWTLLLAVIPYGAYACYHPGHALGVIALVVSGGIFLRRGRIDRERMLQDSYAEPEWEMQPAPAQTPIPPAGRVPTFDASTEAVLVSSEPPPLPEPEPRPSNERRDEIRPPPLPPGEPRPVLKLVHTDGRRADIRDFRRRIAK